MQILKRCVGRIPVIIPVQFAAANLRLRRWFCVIFSSAAMMYWVLNLQLYTVPYCTILYPLDEHPFLVRIRIRWMSIHHPGQHQRSWKRNPKAGSREPPIDVWHQPKHCYGQVSATNHTRLIKAQSLSWGDSGQLSGEGVFLSVAKSFFFIFIHLPLVFVLAWAGLEPMIVSDMLHNMLREMMGSEMVRALGTRFVGTKRDIDFWSQRNWPFFPCRIGPRNLIRLSWMRELTKAQWTYSKNDTKAGANQGSHTTGSRCI